MQRKFENGGGGQAGAPTRRPILAALLTMIATHTLVVVASLTLPVLAPLAAAALEVPARWVGLYTSLLFAGALGVLFLAPGLIARFGALRTSQGALVFAALGLVALASGSIVAAGLSAVLVGFAYGPTNPASSRLLGRLTTEGRRAGVFSIKQTSVPLGSALAGLLAPPLALVFGWHGAALVLALACLVVVAAVQPWRAVLDEDRDPAHALWPRNPFGPLGLVLRHSRLRALGAMGMVYSGAQFTFGAVLVTFLVERAHLNTVQAGAILSAALFTSVFARVLWGYVADLVSPAIVLGSLGVLTAGALLAGLAVTPAWPVAALVAFGCWFGAVGYSWNGVFLACAADEAGAQVAEATTGVMAFVFLGSLSTPLVFTGLIVAFDYEAGLVAMAVMELLAAAYVGMALQRSARSNSALR